MADADLVWQARDGDAAAFRRLVERHRRAALARGRWLCLDADEAEDIVQDAFLQAFLRIDGLVEPDRFGAWLGGIVFNAYRTALRRRAPLTLLDEWPAQLHPMTATGVD